MTRFKTLLLAAGAAIALASTPVLAQQDDQAKPGGMGGMMSPSGGMMDHSQGGMMGQRQGGMMDQDGKPDHCPMGGMGKGMKHGMMHSVPMMEARLAYIKADLEITDAQSAVWDAYADAVRSRHSAMESVHADMMKARENGTIVDRMDARIKALETMGDSLKALKPATEALYAALSDEQKKKADQLLGAGCGMR
ncbi:MAG: Spy/CpxP family protein refolding chaperone [Terriglobia bacterium]